MPAKKTAPDAGRTRLDDRSKMEIVLRKKVDLLPDARNARLHSESQIKQIAGSMEEFGWTNPLLVDEGGGIIAGHGRVLAADMLGLSDDIPCIIISGLSHVQKRALMIADNKLSTNATWDTDLLMMELGEITEEGFDLGVIGFAPEEMDALLGLGGEPSDEDSDAGGGDSPADSGDSKYQEQYGIVVICDDAQHQEKVYADLQRAGYKKLKVVAT